MGARLSTSFYLNVCKLSNGRAIGPLLLGVPDVAVRVIQVETDGDCPLGLCRVHHTKCIDLPSHVLLLQHLVLFAASSMQLTIQGASRLARTNRRHSPFSPHSILSVTPLFTQRPWYQSPLSCRAIMAFPILSQCPRDLSEYLNHL